MRCVVRGASGASASSARKPSHVLVVVCRDGDWTSTPSDEANAFEHLVMFDQGLVACAPHRVERWTVDQAKQAHLDSLPAEMRARLAARPEPDSVR